MSSYEKRHAALLRHFHLTLFKSTIALSALGSYITFTLLLQSISPPLRILSSNSSSPPPQRQQLFSADAIHTLLAASWLLFTLALFFSATMALVLSYCVASVAALGPDHPTASHTLPAMGAPRSMLMRTRSWRMAGLTQDFWSTAAALLVGEVVLAAFLLCALVVASWSLAVGVMAVVATCVWILLVAVVGVLQLIKHARLSRAPRPPPESGRISRLGPDVEASLWNMMTAGGSAPLPTRLSQIFSSSNSPQIYGAPREHGSASAAGQHHHYHGGHGGGGGGAFGHAASGSVFSGFSGTIGEKPGTAGTGTRPSTRRHQPIVVGKPWGSI